MNLSPTLEEISSDVLAMRSPWLPRLLWGLVLALMVAVMAIDGQLSVIPAIIGVVSLVAALFTEEWYFDAAQHEIRRVSGLLPFARTRRHPIDDVERVQVETAERGRSRAPFRRLTLVTREGKGLVVDMGRGDGTELEEYARAISEHLEIELRID
jgi:flagellar biosynthesis protein FliQ